MKHLILLTLLAAALINNVFAQDKFELIQFSTKDGGKIEAAKFDTGSKKAVIFAHGAIFNKESWYFLAEEFQENDITALPIDFRGYGNSVAGSTDKKAYDILGAVSYLVEQGYEDISIIGASMGGAAVLSALAINPKGVNEVVLLAPAGGSPIKDAHMKKLFVVSKEEGLYQRVMQLYAESDNPKTLKEYSGNSHAQHLFKTNNAEALKVLIIDFIIHSK